MQRFNKIEEFTCSAKSIALTIGNFDGVHLGHLAILRSLQQKADYSLVLTFSNHPSEILSQESPSYLTSLPHRLDLLEQEGIEGILVLPFTCELSKLTAENFLKQLKKQISFSHLVLGHDAVIGYQRQGDPACLDTLSKQFGFSLDYLEPVCVNNTIVSSRLIRKCIQQGDLNTASRLLGRPYSIRASVIRGIGKGKELGFPTANLAIANLVLPPLGVWAIEAQIEGETYSGIANLGRAPTLHANRLVMLEAHLFDMDENLYDREIEVIFLKFIREEKYFPTIDALRKQIEKDIEFARESYLSL
jgi:riboflavin kinase/FMN adenylyltransferase